MDEKRTIGGGLTELPKDERDFNLGAIDGPALEIPKDTFLVGGGLKVKDQKDTDLCTAYSVTTASEPQEQKELSPEYQFAKIKELTGSFEPWGADLRTAVKSAVEYGSLPQEKAPYTLETQTRDYVANWENWDKNLEAEASPHKKRAYFSVEPSKLDVFDTIRATLWKYRHEQRIIVTGMLWREEWTEADNGIIPFLYGKGSFGHAFCFKGQTFIGSVPYLTAQLSNGTNIGNNGHFYFSRRTVNTEARFGNFMFKDLPENMTKEEIIEKSIAARRGVLGRAFFYIGNYFKEIIA